MEDYFSPSLASLQQQLEDLQTWIQDQRRCSPRYECDSQFPNPHYEPHHQLSFQTSQSYCEPPSPSYRPYYEPSTPPYNPFPSQYEPYQQHMSPSYLPTPNSPYELYDHPFQPSFHQPQPSFEPYPSPEPINIQPSELDVLPSSQNLDDLTNALTMKYDTLKEKYLVLLMQGTSESFKEMEDIDEFFTAYYDHMLWMKTGGKEGKLWLEEPQENEYGTQTQESYVNPQVESPQAHTPLGNSVPILEENDSPLITTDFVESLIDDSEDEVDEDIIVEHAHMFENTDAHMNACYDAVIGDDAGIVSASFCDNHASYPSTRLDEDIELNDTLPCSCDDDIICMLCIDKKNDKLVAWYNKNFGKEHDASDSTRDEKLDKHEFVKDDPPNKDSKISIYKIINENESFHENESSSDCEDDVLSFKSQNEFLTHTLQAPKDFIDVVDCLIPTEGNHIDFLGCDSYLESSVPKIFFIHPISLQICILGLDTAAGPMFVLQNQTKQSHGYKSNVPTSPLFHQEHLPGQSNMGGVEIKKFMFLIRDENFSYKSLRRFKRKVVSFLSCFLLIVIC